MKKYIIVAVTLALLILDVRIGIADYPAFITFKSEAPQTVDLVINHVIGNRMVIDILSDLLGFAFAIYASTLFIAALKANNNISPSQCDKYMSAWRRTILWSVAGALVYVLERIMPFFLNGNYRFRIEYGLYFLLLLCECMVVFYVMINVCRQMENVDNHTYNNLSTIFAMTGCLCFTIARILYFYDLFKLFVIYYVISVILLILTAWRLKKYK